MKKVGTANFEDIEKLQEVTDSLKPGMFVCITPPTEASPVYISTLYINDKN